MLIRQTYKIKYTANNNIIIIVYVTKHVIFNNEKKCLLSQTRGTLNIYNFPSRSDIKLNFSL